MNEYFEFDVDEDGKTALFHCAERGDLVEVERIIFSMPGTGFSPQRLAMIAHRDNQGLTAAEVAEQAGHAEVASLLIGERLRMEYSE